MIYTPLTKKAIELMYVLHKDQTDKSGLPYVFHPWHVAESMDDEIKTTVALLHDTVEDTDITLEDLTDRGFPEEVVSVLALMTHEEGVDYFDYIKKLADNPIAREVKLADLKHNSDLDRLDHVSTKDMERKGKYAKAIKFLESYNNRGDTSILENSDKR